MAGVPSTIVSYTSFSCVVESLISKSWQWSWWFFWTTETVGEAPTAIKLKNQQLYMVCMLQGHPTLWVEEGEGKVLSYKVAKYESKKGLFLSPTL